MVNMHNFRAVSQPGSFRHRPLAVDLGLAGVVTLCVTLCGHSLTVVGQPLAWIQAYINLGKLMLSVAVLNHIVACGWYGPHEGVLGQCASQPTVQSDVSARTHTHFFNGLTIAGRVGSQQRHEQDGE